MIVMIIMIIILVNRYLLVNDSGKGNLLLILKKGIKIKSYSKNRILILIGSEL